MKILLFSRPGIRHAASELQRIFRCMEERNFDYAVNEEFAAALQTAGLETPPSRLRYGRTVGSLAQGATAMICYGGDGTLLEGIHRLDGAPIPAVGINSGHMGFLTSTPQSDLESLFDEIREGRLHTEERFLLEIDGDLPESDKPAYALNEAAVQRTGTGMIAVETHVDGLHVATYHGDGVIVATPTGSTAYALSAGGPIVAPQCRCLVLAPLAPHNLTMRPLAIPDTSTVTLRIRSRRSTARLSFDNTLVDAPDGTRITIRRSDRSILLGTRHNISFYDTLRDKMMWGIDIRS